MQVVILVILTVAYCYGLTLEDAPPCEGSGCQGDPRPKRQTTNHKTSLDGFITNSIHCTSSTSFNFNSSQACDFCDNYCPCKGSSRVIDFSPCGSDEECDAKETCVYGACVDPCTYYNCPEKTICQPSSHKVRCRAAGPGIRSCRADNECTTEEACFGGKCVDLCSHSVCEAGLICQTQSHKSSCVSRSSAQSSSWPPPGGRRKKFYLVMGTKTEWLGAYMHCLGNNSRLARIENQEENDIVVDMIKQQDIGFDLEYWLGASDYAQVGQYFWVSTSKPIQGFSNWHPGQGWAEDQRCLTYWQSSKEVVKWNDFICTTKYNFVCEYYE